MTLNKLKWTLFAAFFLPIFSIAQKKAIEVEDVWQRYQFYAAGINGFTGLDDGISYTAFSERGNNQKLQRFAFADGSPLEVVLDPSQFPELRAGIDSYRFSPDEEGLLVATQTEGIYRHSSQGLYYILHRPNNKLYPVYNQPIRNVNFSPVDDKVAFSHQNNLYVKDLKSDQITPITQDGTFNSIINGTPDWVYEEEFSTDQAYEWSPNGQYIAYVRFDESQVPEFSMDVYGQNLYPAQNRFKYPKAGEPNSKVSLWIYTLNGVSKAINLGEDFEYIPRIYWTPGGKLVAMLMNRLQNNMRLVQIDPISLETKTIYQESDNAYLEVPGILNFIDDKNLLISSDRDGFMHVYLHNTHSQKATQLTKGAFDVETVYGFDSKTKSFYYQAAEAGAPHQRHVYRCNLSGKSQKLSKLNGWNALEFNKQMTYYILTHENSQTPPSYTLYSAKTDKLLRVLQNNDDLKQRLQTFEMGQKSFMQVELNGQSMSAWIMKPAEYDANKTYPVLLFVYGGPGSQTVKDEYDGFNHMWYEHLLAKGYVVASIDNRGTGAMGRDFRKSTYGQMGKLESEDQIAFAKYLIDQKIADPNRLGIWGWSYGGYMSSLCLAKGADVFKMAMAVAPVTNWRFYDNIYTERYMGLPEQNGNGYDENSPLQHANKIKGQYLLVHGSADDNVHVQNTMRMTEALVQANVPFTQFIYPDKNHGIYGGNTRLHLYKSMTQFVLNNL